MLPLEQIALLFLLPLYVGAEPSMPRGDSAARSHSYAGKSTPHAEANVPPVRPAMTHPAEEDVGK